MLLLVDIIYTVICFIFISFFFLIFCLCQTISVSVSVLTLSCIAQDRWYAICHPLKFKSTAKRARRSIILIWLVSCMIMIPQAVVMECKSLLPELTNKTVLFTQCDEQWGGKPSNQSGIYTFAFMKFDKWTNSCALGIFHLLNIRVNI